MGDVLGAARAAVDGAQWEAALDELDALGPDARTAECLELRAQAAYGNGEFEAAVQAWEDLHALYVESGQLVEAARAAAMVAMYLMMDTGLMAPVRGWLRRADRLLEGAGETPAHALVAMSKTYERFMCGDMAGAGTHAARAIELGSRFGVQPAVVIGRVASARVSIYEGHVEEGLRLLDEIGILLMSGEIDPLTTGMMYCELICAAQGLAHFDMASEWTEVMERWRHGAAFGGINGRCRVHRAEILKISGPCDLAEAEALGACEELRPWMRREFGWPLVELGNIRLRKGDLTGAEEAFTAAHGHAWSPQPGLALLRLAQGRLDEASSLIDDAIAHPFDIPSKERPPFGDLRLAPLLDAQSEIATARGDVDTARRAADQLRAIADAYRSRCLDTSATLAAARAALLGGHLTEAIHDASVAISAWTDIGAPYEAATARMVLGEAHHRSDNPGLAHMEWRAAQSAFGAFGATRCADQARRRLAEAPMDAPGAAPVARTFPHHVASFRLDGDMREIGFGQALIHMRDLKGLRYVARLLDEPGREFHVLDLVAVEEGTLPTRRTMDSHDELHLDTGAGLALIDDQAREAYRRRLVEVDEDIADAQQMNDEGRLELALHDREYLIAELSRAVGLGKRHRTVCSDSERARSSVTRSIRYALNRLAAHNRDLATHLQQAVKTGIYCSYVPDPFTPIDWRLDAPARITADESEAQR